MIYLYEQNAQTPDSIHKSHSYNSISYRDHVVYTAKENTNTSEVGALTNAGRRVILNKHRIAYTLSLGRERGDSATGRMPDHIAFYLHTEREFGSRMSKGNIR